MTKYLAGAAIGAIMTLASGVAGAEAHAATWAPCQTEDQTTRCVWDARHMGNGKGRSFKVRWNGEIQYLSHARAHRMLNAR